MTRSGSLSRCCFHKKCGCYGDERTYENVVALRCVTSIDGMTADWAKIPYEILEKISNRY